MNAFREKKLDFDDPYGVCSVNSEYLCITYPSEGKMQIFSKDYELIATFEKVMSALLNCPRGVATNNLNQLIICDSYCHRLIITNFKFEELNIFGKYGNGPSEFYSPFDVLYHNSFLYVCDTGNKRIQKFTDNFGHLHSFKLEYHPLQIMILSDLAIIRDDKNYLNFHYLDTFKFKRKSRTKGLSGLIGKRVYQIDSDYVYFYDSDANLCSKSKIEKFIDFDKGNTCIFRKDIVITCKNRLLLIENVL